MMSYLSTEVILKRDFPRKVQAQCNKVLGNLETTLERTGKLMGDVWDMWMGALGGGGSSGSSGNGGQRR